MRCTSWPLCSLYSRKLFPVYSFLHRVLSSLSQVKPRRSHPGSGFYTATSLETPPPAQDLEDPYLSTGPLLNPAQVCPLGSTHLPFPEASPSPGSMWSLLTHGLLPAEGSPRDKELPTPSLPSSPGLELAPLHYRRGGLTSRGYCKSCCFQQ